MTIKESKAYQYAMWCLPEDNEKIPYYVRLQAKAWIKIADEEDEEAFVDEKALERLCKVLKLMMHPDLHITMYEGIEPYAWFLIVAVFCTKLKNEKGLDIRYYQTAVLEICRKNYKTFYAAIIFILLMLTEPQFSRFFSVAPDLKLSSELKGAIRKIIKSSPALYDEYEPAFKILRSEVRCEIKESEYIPLAYSEDTMDGKLANAFLADEAGAMDSYPVEAMRSSQITLLNKLGIIVSTQYPNDDNVLIDEIDISKKVLDGLLDKKRRFSLLYEPDEKYLKDDQWMSADNIIFQSNPVAVSNDVVFEAIKELRELAVLYENKRENYLCKHNNIKFASLGTEGFISILKLKECRIAEDLKFWQGKHVFLGLDLSQTEDNTAVAMVTAWEGKIYARVWGFIPTNRVKIKSKKENVDYAGEIKKGNCFDCGDDVIDYTFVENFILNLENEYGVEIVQIGYDKWNALSSIQKLEKEGYEAVEIKQHSSVLHMPTKWLLENILSKRFCYAKNTLLEINFQNARCTYDTNMNRYVNKKKSAGKVDMVVALINAVCLLQKELLFAEENFVVQS